MNGETSTQTKLEKLILNLKSLDYLERLISGHVCMVHHLSC